MKGLPIIIASVNGPVHIGIYRLGFYSCVSCVHVASYCEPGLMLSWTRSEKKLTSLVYMCCFPVHVLFPVKYLEAISA